MTRMQIDREKRSVLFNLRKFPTGRLEFSLLVGYTQHGRAIRGQAIAELLAERLIERGHGGTLRLVRT